MSADYEFKFNLSVSQQGYATKPTSEQVPKIVFEPRLLTIDSALQCATEGRAFCYSFTTPNPKGLITVKDKKEANFQATSTIIYDFDDMDTSMADYIESLSYKPSFAYPTYSNGKSGFSRFRLAYVFDKDVTSVGAFNNLYHAIANANGFVNETKEHGGWDVRNVAQLYYGTTSTASTYNGEVIYSQDDFKPFVITTTEQKATVSNRTEPDYTKYESSISTEFLEDFTHLSQKALFAKYRDDFHPNYFLSLSTPLILDESEMFYRFPDDYVCVRHKCKGKYTLRWEIGEDRKKKMFITAQMMMFNLPSMSIENLLYNLRIERQWYYDNSDNKISNEFLIQTAIRAFNKPYPLEPSEHYAFASNKAFWQEQGYNANQAKMFVRRYLKAKEVERLYNPSLSREENLKILKENGVSISEKTLKRMVSRGDIKIDIPKESHTYLSCCPDNDTILMLQLIHRNGYITQRELSNALNVSLPTIKRYMREMKGKLISREGDNRTGRWVVLPPFGDCLSRTVLKPELGENNHLFLKEKPEMGDKF